MGNFRSKIFTLLLCSAALVGCAFADGIPVDPVIQINDPTCPTETPCAPLVGAGVPFTFMADDNGGGPPPGTNMFQVSGPGFFSLDVQTAGFIDPASINCTSNRFNCTVTNLDNNTVTDMFFTEFICEAEVCSTGFPTGDVFTVNLGTTGWGADREFVAEANLTTPADNPTLVSEPSTMALFTVSLACFGMVMGARILGRHFSAQNASI
jgi:hypothetical protein